MKRLLIVLAIGIGYRHGFLGPRLAFFRRFDTVSRMELQLIGIGNSHTHSPAGLIRFP